MRDFLNSVACQMAQLISIASPNKGVYFWGVHQRGPKGLLHFESPSSWHTLMPSNLGTMIRLILRFFQEGIYHIYLSTGILAECFDIHRTHRRLEAPHSSRGDWQILEQCSSKGWPLAAATLAGHGSEVSTSDTRITQPGSLPMVSTQDDQTLEFRALKLGTMP